MMNPETMRTLANEQYGQYTSDADNARRMRMARGPKRDRHGWERLQVLLHPRTWRLHDHGLHGGAVHHPRAAH